MINFVLSSVLRMHVRSDAIGKAQSNTKREMKGVRSTYRVRPSFDDRELIRHERWRYPRRLS